MGRGVTLLIELRRGDEVTRTWPDTELLPALEGFWTALLEEGALHSRWYRSQLSVPQYGDLDVPREDLTRLNALAVRRWEPGFIQALAEVHSRNLTGLSLELMIAIEPRPPKEVQQVVDLLRRSLALKAPLRHLGHSSEPLPIPSGAAFTITETHGAYPNGAGTMTMYSGWQLNVYTTVRITVEIESSDEEGSPTTWSITVRARHDVPLEPLLDAFDEQGLSVRAERIR